MLPRRANAYYSGPVSDHFDGVEFFNPGGQKPHGVGRIAQLYFAERWSPWPDRVPTPVRDTPPARVGAGARITFIGHASWLIQVWGRNILVDPVWSDRASPVRYAGPRRVNEPGVPFDRLPPIDDVLVTHNHYDHLDVATLGALWRLHRPRIVTPLGNDTIMRQEVPGLVATTVDWHQSVDLGVGVRVHAEPSDHWSARGLRDRRHALWASFVIETPAGKIYAVGDSGFGEGRTFRAVKARHPSIALALLPIGAYEPRWFMRHHHMNPAEAVAAFRLCGARSALGHHWGTFQLTTEPRDLPPRQLAEALREQGIPPERFQPVHPGDVHRLSG
jgi:L-ascorbate metabolism protein UlaG (beta-lactamase superfamily)